ncbi:MAG TPA: S8 family serine peptidase [Gaiellaceae bacterium]|nr:S8 family serine peptidase [Gaiellaceae bacterium]
MRRPALLTLAAAALVAAAPAAAELRPVDRTFGDVTYPLVRAGEPRVPAGHARGRVTVVVQLDAPPLAQYGRSLHGPSARRRLTVTSTSSRAYLGRLAAAQNAAAAQLRRAIPEATVGRRYRVVLNGFAVELPARDVPTLVRQGFSHRVYPSLRYTLRLNESPGLIHARAYAARHGARGEGMKIAVVDDGIDQTNPFFDPRGYSYPPGYPKGGTRWTSPKVIVARTFPGPGAGRPGRLAVDPRVSFHGTHVAGIAAGNEGTTAPPGEDHPGVSGLSGVAPRAHLGNYRVFTVPTPIGHVANTPEIIAAFEAAVADGMDVINFSGGGAETEPRTDAMNEVVRNVAAAGVLPVISAGNDRDEFGLGTAGSPGTAPDALSVAATSNAHVFAPALRVTAPGAPANLRVLAFRPAGDTPAAWTATDQLLVDVGTIVGTDGRAVDRLLCGTSGNPNEGPGTLPPGSLRGAIALASRGTCTFVSKAERARAAGAIGLVLVDNRPGEANGIPLRLAIPAGMVADLDGARLRAYLATTGGRTLVRIGKEPDRIETGRSGIVTSFSSAGPTAFGHQLKPDVSAPGGAILSATLPRFGGPFAVFDGTSMAAPHAAGAAALLLQRHRTWTARQLKSALVSTAGPAWEDTARTREAPVILGGGGQIDLLRADDPLVFTDPVSVAFPDLNVNRGARTESRLVRISDAGGGAGTWEVELRPQSAPAGSAVELPPALAIGPGGDAHLPVVARAAADATAGDAYGFVVLRRGDVERRIPYFFSVTRPGLERVPVRPLRRLQTGDTRNGTSHANVYRFPSAPFGPPPDYTGPPMVQDGAEQLYETTIVKPVANFGVAVIASSDGAVIDPWVLGSRDENDVQGAAGTPVNVNSLTFGYRAQIGAAGAAMPLPGRYYVSVDSGRDVFSGRRLAGQYLLQSWEDDVSPPLAAPLTTRVSAGRPTIAVRVVDGLFRPESGVDPLSLALAYRGVLVSASFYDPFSGIAVFALPREAPALRAGTTRAGIIASDYQEAKNVASVSEDVMPNTSFTPAPIRVVRGPAVTWLAPERNECVRGRLRLVVAASASRGVARVVFSAGGRTVATVRRGDAGIYSAPWRAPRGRGAHGLRATVVDRTGAASTAARTVRTCR